MKKKIYNFGLKKVTVSHLNAIKGRLQLAKNEDDTVFKTTTNPTAATNCYDCPPTTFEENF